MYLAGFILLLFILHTSCTYIFHITFIYYIYIFHTLLCIYTEKYSINDIYNYVTSCIYQLLPEYSVSVNI